MRKASSTDDSGTHLWLVMMKAHRAFSRVAERSVADTGLCGSDFRVLELLLHKGPQPVNDLGRRVGLSSGAITTAVDRLEGSGLVRREAHPTDRRARTVHLTPAGQREARSAFLRHKAALDSAAAGLPDAERRSLIGLLKKVGRYAEQLNDPSPAQEQDPT